MRFEKLRLMMIVAIGLSVVPCTPLAAADTEGVDDKVHEARRQINDAAEDALAELFAQSDVAKLLYDNAYGYAFFDRLDLSLIDSGYPVGVVVKRGSSTRTYMGLGNSGINLGSKVRKYQVVFFFGDEETYLEFLEDGSRLESGARGYGSSPREEDTAELKDGMAFYWISLDPVSESTQGGGAVFVGSVRQWRRGPVPTCRPHPLDRLNED